MGRPMCGEGCQYCEAALIYDPYGYELDPPDAEKIAERRADELDDDPES